MSDPLPEANMTAPALRLAGIALLALTLLISQAAQAAGPAAVVAQAAGSAAKAAPGPAAPAKADDGLRQALTISAGPGSAAIKGNATSLAPALRCMDGLFRTHGARGISVIIEDIPDSTKKVNVGAREMFVSATSQMTRASRAIRLIPYDGNRKVFQDLFKGQEDIQHKAAFAIQGSISQFDESLLRKQRDGGICLGPLCVGGAESDSYSGLSLDIGMLNLRDDLTLVPGVISKNSVLVRRHGQGADGDLSFKKFGINYNFSTTASEGQGQALRTLVELAAIELYGRLLKIPYWVCLGVGADDAGVKTEIEDWWDMLQSDVPSLVAWLKVQMRARGVYPGEPDATIDDGVLRGVRAYKHALGLADDLNLDHEFFRRYLAADHAQAQPLAVARLKAIEQAEGPLPAPAAAPPAAAPVAAATPEPPPKAATAAAPAGPAGQPPAAALRIDGSRGPQHRYRPGEPVEVQVQVAQRGFLYCFLIDDSRTVTQFFPNPAQPSAAVAAGQVMPFPGRFPFQLVASRKGLVETIACHVSGRDLGPAVPLAPAVRDAAGLRAALNQRAGSPVETGVFDVQVH
ncbi:MAG: DUF4384 domain-containing protein [Aquabacterium sp.]